MSEKVKVYIVGNGCDRRLLDSARLHQYFKQNECEIINSPKKADYILLNTCGMSSLQEDTCFNLMKHYEKYDGELIVHGCLPQTAPTRFQEEFQGRSFDSQDIEKIDEYFPEFEKPIKEIEVSGELYQDISYYRKFISKFEFSWNFFFLIWVALKFKLLNWRTPLHPRLRDGIYLKTSQGCPENCGFCVIPKAVGNIKSRPIEEITKEYANFLKQGQRHFIITGDNAGSYGIECGSNFPELLKSLDETDEAYEVQWTLNELHPRWLIKYHKDILRYCQMGKIKELCVPVQSGADRVLKNMNRHHKSQDVALLLKQIKATSPNIELNTDIIIGYPGETEEEFRQSLELILDVKFDQVNFFSYSDREGSLASQMENKLSQNEILKRLKTVMKTLKKHSIRFSYT